MPPFEIDLRGKDYFSVVEAAHYCCVSPDHFAKQESALRDMGIEPLRVMGKKVYRRADLAQFIEKSPEWQRCASAKKAGISTGAIHLPANVLGALLGESQKRMPASRLKRLKSSLPQGRDEPSRHVLHEHQSATLPPST